MLLELGQRRHTRRLQGFVGLDLVRKDVVRKGQNFPPTIAAVEVTLAAVAASPPEAGSEWF